MKITWYDKLSFLLCWMKPSTALEIAKQKFIMREEERYVCHALPRNGTGFFLRTKIMESIFPYSSVSMWLYMRGISITAKNTDDYKDKIREYRIAWIDWMIEGYKSKGL